jgi:hypothetical protein
MDDISLMCRNKDQHPLHSFVDAAMKLHVTDIVFVRVDAWLRSLGKECNDGCIDDVLTMIDFSRYIECASRYDTEGNHIKSIICNVLLNSHH